MVSDRAYTKDELQPILEEILRAALDTDLGFYNRGGIRDEIAAGPVSARMIWNIEPFGKPRAPDDQGKRSSDPLVTRTRHSPRSRWH